MTAEKMSLMRSERGKSGMIYTDLGRMEVFAASGDIRKSTEKPAPGAKIADARLLPKPAPSARAIPPDVRKEKRR